MRRAFSFLLVVIPLFLCNGIQAVSSDEFYPIEAIQPGMTGIMLCGFGMGGEVQGYEIVVKSVMGNKGRNGDGWRSVLIEAGKDLMEQHNGFVDGMSGAPVYIDGKLAGAFYSHDEWTLQNYGLMRPIDQMLKLLDDESIPGPDGVIPIADAGSILSGGREFTSIAFVKDGCDKEYIASLIDKGILPMGPASLDVTELSGPLEEIPPWVDIVNSLQPYSPEEIFLDETMEPFHPTGPDKFIPGCTITVVKTIGDVTNYSIGCLTYIDTHTGRYIAFGHDALGGIGEVSVPLGDCYTYHSHKQLDKNSILGLPTKIIGSISTDSWQGIEGKLGEIPPMLKVELHLEDIDYNKRIDSLFYSVSDSEVYPGVVPSAIQSAVERALDVSSGGFVKVKFEVALSDGRIYGFNQAYYDSANYSSAGVSDTGRFLNTLAMNDFEQVTPAKMDYNISLTKAEKRMVIKDLRYISAGEEKTAFPETVKPGDEITIKIRIEPEYGQPYDKSYTLKVPGDFPLGPAKVQIFGGLKSLPYENEIPKVIFEDMRKSKDKLVDPLHIATPTNLDELMKTLQPDYRADELIVQLDTSPANGASDTDKAHIQEVTSMDGVVVGVFVRDIKVEGGEVE